MRRKLKRKKSVKKKLKRKNPTSELRKQRKEQGLCGECGGPRDDPKKLTCLKCLGKRKARLAKQAKEDKCRCGATIKTDKSRCEKCLKKNSN